MKTTVTDSCDNYLAKYGDSLKSKVIAHLRAKYPDSDIPASDYEILCSQDDVDETTVFQDDLLMNTIAHAYAHGAMTHHMHICIAQITPVFDEKEPGYLE